MTTQERSRQGFWQSLFGRDEKQEPQEEIPAPVVETPLQEAGPELEIAPNDPIVAYFASASGVVEIDKLDLDSPALRAMKEADIKVVVPLVSQGELIGLLNLGPRLSQQEYSADDRKLLNDLATQTAPAVQVAQLVRQQQQQAQERERIEQELRVARLIQQTLLPKSLPDLPGYDVAAYYQPAREVGGDFYDFLDLEDGRFGLVVGHDLPYRRKAAAGGAEELRATGMPLGLLPGMEYEEKEIVLERGDSVLFYSDGLVEAHDPHREMFGFPRLQGLVAGHRTGGEAMVNFLLSELSRFTGDEWEQEDDITLVTLERSETA